jgi:hypothetical protein
MQRKKAKKADTKKNEKGKSLKNPQKKPSQPYNKIS